MAKLWLLALCAVLLAIPSDARQYKCNFSSNLCNWTQDSTDDSFWTRRSGGTPSDDTGPYNGYGGSGSYIYIEASDQSTGQKSRIISPMLTASPPGTIIGNLTFYRSMYGNAMGTLRVFLKINGVLAQIGQIFTKRNSRTWVKESISFKCPHDLGGCQIVFEATRGSDYTSDVAIDEVTIDFETRGPVVIGPGNSTIHYHDHSHHISPNETRDAGTQYCSFDRGNCSFLTQDSNAPIQWTSLDKGDPSVDTGPLTGYGGSGSFLLMDASRGMSGYKARLISDVISQASVNLTFWYSMYGYDVGALRVYIKDSNGERLEWERTGDQETHDWLSANVRFSSYAPCQIIFEAERGVFRHGDIGLDEVSMAVSHVIGENDTDTDAYEISTCDFDSNSFCNWFPSPRNKVQWELWSGPTPKSNTGPRGDYTTGSGKYALFQDGTSRANLTAVLTSNVIRAPLYRTLHIAYHMLGYNGQNSRLNVYTVLESNGSRSRVWTRTPEEGEREWQAQEINIASKLPYSIEIEAVGGDRGYGDIAIDNLQIKSGVLPEVASCDFKASFCSWTQRDDDDFDWLLNTGETSTKNTGPMDVRELVMNWFQSFLKGNVLRGSIRLNNGALPNLFPITTAAPQGSNIGNAAGSYAYAETSFPRKAGDVAVIESPAIGPLGEQATCVRFEYNMYGSQVGKLELRQTEDDGGKPQVLWSRTGSQGQKWWPAYVTVPADHENYRFQFRAERKNGIRGDIALRGVKVEADACEEDTPYNCDFETDTCGWKPAPGSAANWTYSVVSPGGDSDGSPPNDHTTGSAQGGYLYVSNNPTQATIQTLITTTHVLCVQFWYFSYGNDNTGAFEFLTQPSDSPSPTVKWTSYRETVAWQRASISVQSNAKYYMGFRAKAVDGYKAIDDVTVSTGLCA